MIRLKQVLRSPFSVLRSPFSVLRSPFSVFRFPFSVFRSPFSVFRSPFSVLRSPFSVLRVGKFALAGLFCALIFTFAACGGDGDTGTLYGILTVEGIPAPYELTFCQVNTNPNLRWIKLPEGGTLYDLSSTEYYPNVIGTGFKDSHGGTENTTNKVTVFGTKFSWNDEEDDWRSDSYDDFTFSGKASIWASFTRKDTQKTVRVGYNNVQFTGGNAVVDYNTSSFALPTTDGRFTLTGIPTEHNGKHAILVGAYGTPTPTALYGLEDATSLNVWKGIPIKDGTAEIRLFKLTTGDQQFSRFGEAADNATLVIIIQDDDDFNLEHYQANQMTYPHLVYTSVDFVSGKANKPFNEGTKVGGL